MHLLIGITLIAIALALTIWVGKRKFARTNGAGVEQHASYKHRVITEGFERVVRWVVIAAALVGSLLLIAV